MKIPPRNTVVAYWIEPKDYLHLCNHQWETVQHYILFDPVDNNQNVFYAHKYQR